MKLYPPYNKWNILIQNPEKFRLYLNENIEFHNSNGKASLRGKLSPNGFFVERKVHTQNGSRPQIKGVIKVSENGKSILTLTMESKKSILYIIGVFSIVMIITAIAQLKPMVLAAIPIIALWLLLGGFVLHSIEVKKTEKEIHTLLRKAEEN